MMYKNLAGGRLHVEDELHDEAACPRPPSSNSSSRAVYIHSYTPQVTREGRSWTYSATKIGGHALDFGWRRRGEEKDGGTATAPASPAQERTGVVLSTSAGLMRMAGHAASGPGGGGAAAASGAAAGGSAAVAWGFDGRRRFGGLSVPLLMQLRDEGESDAAEADGLLKPPRNAQPQPHRRGEWASRSWAPFSSSGATVAVAADDFKATDTEPTSAGANASADAPADAAGDARTSTATALVAVSSGRRFDSGSGGSAGVRTVVLWDRQRADEMVAYRRYLLSLHRNHFGRLWESARHTAATASVAVSDRLEGTVSAAGPAMAAANYSSRGIGAVGGGTSCGGSAGGGMSRVAAAFDPSPLPPQQQAFVFEAELSRRLAALPTPLYRPPIEAEDGSLESGVWGGSGSGGGDGSWMAAAAPHAAAALLLLARVAGGGRGERGGNRKLRAVAGTENSKSPDLTDRDDPRRPRAGLEGAAVAALARWTDAVDGSDAGGIAGIGGASTGVGARATVTAEGWSLRLRQVPHYSRLRRYRFVACLGSGSHGVTMLVTTGSEKSSMGPGDSRNGDGGRNAGSSKVLRPRNWGFGRETAASLSSPRLVREGLAAESSPAAPRWNGTGAATEMVAMTAQPGQSISRNCHHHSTAARWRVLKESECLAEAVNEARLLTLVGAATDANDGGGGGAGEAGGGAGVVRLFDFFVETLAHRTVAYLELEYCEGGDLASWIEAVGGKKRGGSGDSRGGSGGGSGMHAEDIVSVVEGVCRGLQTLHAHGIVHRDLSPSNVLLAARDIRPLTGRTPRPTAGDAVRMTVAAALPLHGASDASSAAGRTTAAAGAATATGQVPRGGPWAGPGPWSAQQPGWSLLFDAKVADLGVSTRLTPSRPATHHAAGAVAFMAPEVRRFLLGAPVAYGRPADVWAVGALIYAAAVGDAAPAALATESAEALATEVGRRTRCPGLQAAALAALHPAPSRRPSAAALGAMLARCRADLAAGVTSRL